jgi:hypothetical protein
MGKDEIDEIMENFKRACKEAAISFNRLADRLNAQHKRKRKTTKADTIEKRKVFNMPIVSNNKVAVCEIEGCNREVLSDSTMCPHHFAVSLDSQTDC